MASSTRKKVKQEEPTELLAPQTGSLVFISHDSRDAELAEAFSKLLSSVSAGVLKSFRSSDRKGSQGIEYGTEWYPELMKKLSTASDVVCLLTQRSVERPWILYEAGVAKGKLGTPVFGIALGIPLSRAATGRLRSFKTAKRRRTI
jgi:TIR domain